MSGNFLVEWSVLSSTDYLLKYFCCTVLEEELVFLEQFGFRVTDFSSQYGNANGVSYTANNILGPPCRFPAYGDFSETYLPVFIFF